MSIYSEKRNGMNDLFLPMNELIDRLKQDRLGKLWLEGCHLVRFSQIMFSASCRVILNSFQNSKSFRILFSASFRTSKSFRIMFSGSCQVILNSFQDCYGIPSNTLCFIF